MHKKIARLWNRNAADWIRASEDGLDVWRDQVNTKAFLAMLPDVSQHCGLDVGCGEGHHSRLIARRCAKLMAIDISSRFIAFNKQQNICPNLFFRKANCSHLPFKNNSFDFAVSTMAFMDMAELDRAFSEIYRVLRPDGFLQFSITHPCFNECIGHWLDDRSGFVVQRYFATIEGEVQQWQHYFSNNLPAFQTPRFLRPLSDWLNGLIHAGFTIEKLMEPVADESAIAKHPVLASTHIAGHSLLVRARR